MTHFGTRAALGTGRRVAAASLSALLLALIGGAGAQAGEAADRSPFVRAGTPNDRVALASGTAVKPGSGKGTSFDVTRAIGARKLWEQGYTGEGVDVALIDSGVVPVRGLRQSGKVIHGPDFSWSPEARG